MTIGLLVPRSGLFPSIGFDIVEGLRAGLSYSGITDAKINVENIGFAGDSNLIYAACEKLLMNGADVVAGYVNPATSEELNPLFKTAGKIFIAIDPGYHIPSGLEPLSNVINLSLQGAFCCRVLAKLAAVRGSGNVAYATSFYDAGYRSGLGYACGIHESGGKIIFNHVTHLKKAEFTLDPLHRFLQEQPADAIFASFCGDMNDDFFRHVKDKNMQDQVKIYCSPFMAEEVFLDSLEYMGTDLYTAVPWARELKSEANMAFKEAMTKQKRKANLMSLLGWEAGLLTAAVAEYLPLNCGEIELQSPRGTVKCGTSYRVSEAPVYIGKIGCGKNGFSILIIEDDLEIELEDERKRWYNNMIEVSKVQMDTWNNAYLCIE